MNNTINLLLLEDNAGDVRLIEELLKESNRYRFKVTQTGHLNRAIELCKNNDFEIILLDLNLPDSVSIDTFETLQNSVPEIPIVILTGLANDELALKAIRCGAQDYLLKGRIDGESLPRLLYYAMERKKMQEELLLLIKNYPTTIYRFDKDHRCVFVNPAIEKFRGKPPAYFIGKTIDEIGNSPSECSYWNKIVREVFETKHSLQGETEVMRKNGKTNIYWFMVPEFNSKGKIRSVLSTEYDITERKTMELALIDERNQAQLYLDMAGTMIVLIDVDKKVITINKKGCEILGFSEKKIVGKNWFKYFLPESIKEKAEKAFEKKIHNNINPMEYYECRVLTKSGEERVIYWHDSIIRDASGQIISTLSSGTDITEQKRSADELRKSYDVLQKTLEGTVLALASIAGKRDPFTQSHQIKVAKLACIIADDLHFPKKRIKGLQFAGLLHDIGKISVPAEILTKPGKLTDAEYRIIKTHSQQAYDILENIIFPWPIADIILQHHERLDGSGYPNGLKGDKMLLEAKILAVADVVEAMSSPRPYRPAPGLDKALEEIKKNRGRLYDPTVVDICIRLVADKKFDFEND